MLTTSPSITAKRIFSLSFLLMATGRFCFVITLTSISPVYLKPSLVSAPIVLSRQSIPVCTVSPAGITILSFSSYNQNTDSFLKHNASNHWIFVNKAQGCQLYDFTRKNSFCGVLQTFFPTLIKKAKSAICLYLSSLL